MEENTKNCNFKESIDVEKIAVYGGLLITFVTAMVYIADIKERVAILETKIEKMDKK